MPAPQTAGLPPGLDLWAGCVVRVTAIDPATGAPVAGVNLADVALTVRNLSGGELDSGAFMLVPGPGS